MCTCWVLNPLKSFLGFFVSCVLYFLTLDEGRDVLVLLPADMS